MFFFWQTYINKCPSSENIQIVKLGEYLERIGGNISYVDSKEDNRNYKVSNEKLIHTFGALFEHNIKDTVPIIAADPRSKEYKLPIYNNYQWLKISKKSWLQNRFRYLFIYCLYNTVSCLCARILY